MAEYGSMLLVSILAAILFLGGWNGPLPLSANGWGSRPRPVLNRADLVHYLDPGLSTYLANFLGMLNVLFKGVVGVTVMMWVRWTLPAACASTR